MISYAHYTNVECVVHLHVRTCVPLFQISGTAGRIALDVSRDIVKTFTERTMLKYGVLLDPLVTRFAQVTRRGVCTCASAIARPFQVHPFASARSSPKRHFTGINMDIS